jgi:hypothetical protein
MRTQQSVHTLTHRGSKKMSSPHSHQLSKHNHNREPKHEQQKRGLAIGFRLGVLTIMYNLPASCMYENVLSCITQAETEIFLPRPSKRVYTWLAPSFWKGKHEME